MSLIPHSPEIAKDCAGFNLEALMRSWMTDLSTWPKPGERTYEPSPWELHDRAMRDRLVSIIERDDTDEADREAIRYALEEMDSY